MDTSIYITSQKTSITQWLKPVMKMKNSNFCFIQYSFLLICDISICWKLLDSEKKKNCEHAHLLFICKYSLKLNVYFNSDLVSFYNMANEVSFQNKAFNV